MSNLFQKILESKKKFGAIRKDGKNPHYKSKYSTIDNVIAVIDPVLEEVGLTYFIVQTKDMTSKLIVVDVESGEKIESEAPILLNKQDMQQLGSAYTYNRRYLLVTFFGLEQEDDDGNKASGYEKKQPKPQPRITPQQITELETLLHEKQVDRNKFFNWLGVGNLGDIAEGNFAKVKETLLKK